MTFAAVAAVDVVAASTWMLRCAVAAAVVADLRKTWLASRFRRKKQG